MRYGRRAVVANLGGDLPDDEVLRYRYGEASSGAAIWIGKEDGYESETDHHAAVGGPGDTRRAQDADAAGD